MTKSEFYEAVIESKARVIYGEAQELIDGAEIEKLSHVKDNILRCADLAKVLMAKRFKEGSLDLEVPETILEIDGSGEPIDVIRSERLFAHRLIEELMLAANVAVGKFLATREVPALFRVHEAPDEEKIANLQKYMENMGHKTQISGGKLQKRLTRALQEFDGKPEAQIIHILTLRSMSQAKYSHNNVGHFGLGFDFYTHFTSPIRRYPDLVVHRLLKNQVMPNSHYRLMNEDDLATSGTWLSACEQRSAKAERQIQSIKKARFMHRLLGESYDGLISSVTKFGVFVLLREFNIDGLIRLEDLGAERFEFDEENLILSAKRSGKMYKMGDVVRVTVSLVDIEQGQVNFVLEKSVVKNVSAHDQVHVKAGHSRSEKKAEFSKQIKHAKKKEKTKGKFSKNAGFAKKYESTEKNETKSPFFETSEKDSTQYTPKPRYASLTDYLDQKKKKGSHEEKSEQKPAFRSSENRKNSEKRRSSENDSRGVRKARPEKSRRKNKSR
jgi:ribonuclease R